MKSQNAGGAAGTLTAEVLGAQIKRAYRHKLLSPLLYSISYALFSALILFTPHGARLRRLVQTRPEIIQMVLAPYLALNWDVRTRFARMADHCNSVALLGGPLDFSANEEVKLLRLTQVDPRYSITLDQARWLVREGQLIFSLWSDNDRIFHISFCISTQGGRRIAYIGALQGRNEVDQFGHTLDVLQIYRDFTESSNGMRPRDFIVELFKMFCRTLDISEIFAVSDENHPGRQKFDEVKLSYNEVWRERGGISAGNGFFTLPVVANRRPLESIPGKKRAMYRSRYAMLESIEQDLRQALLRASSNIEPLKNDV